MKILSLNRFIYLVITLFFLSPKSGFSQTPSFSLSLPTQCYVQGGPNGATAYVTGTVAGATSYSWSIMGACAPTVISSGTGTQVSIFYACCGTYTYVCIALSSTAILGSTTQTAVVICSPSVTIFGPTSICPGATTTLQASGAQTYTWSNGSTGLSIVVSPSVATTYSVIGTSASGCIDTSSKVVNIIPPLNASFTYTQGTNGQVFFTNTSTNSISATSYSWNFGNSQTSAGTNSNVSSTYSANGVYTIALTATNGCSSTTITHTLLSCYHIFTILGNTTTCSGAATTLQIAGAQTYTWNTGSTSPTINVSSTVTTMYSVHGTSGGGCLDSASVILTVLSPPNAGFTYTQGSNGQVFFTNTSVNTPSNTSYIWNFGNGQTSNNTNPSITYSANGIYSITLTAVNNCGSVSVTQTVSINSIVINCAAGFSANAGLFGTYTFSSTSAGTNTNTIYLWNFGNGAASYSAIGSAGVSPPAQTYLSGTYTVSLTISNSNPFCTNTTSVIINVCSNQALFYTMQLSTTTFSFISTSTGTTASTTFSWNFGDGSTGTGVTSIHSYTAAGIYNISLTASNSSSCTATQIDSLVVTSCSLTSNFTHTILTNGVVTFSNTSLNPSSGIINYKWDFGDGIFSFLSSPTHTYATGGTYNVTLDMRDSISFCKDSLTQSINITGIACAANSNFTLVPTNTPQYWNAIPAYPWNVATASWEWGDGSSTNGLYTSHQYASAGNYSICLSVTVSCGSSSSYCYSYNVYKSTDTNSQIVNINILPPEKGNGLVIVNSQRLSLNIYPNPNNGEFTLNLDGIAEKNITLSVYSLMGEVIYFSEEEMQNDSSLKIISLKDVCNGIYFVKINAGKSSYIQKIIINN